MVIMQWEGIKVKKAINNNIFIENFLTNKQNFWCIILYWFSKKNNKCFSHILLISKGTWIKRDKGLSMKRKKDYGWVNTFVTNPKIVIHI